MMKRRELENLLLTLETTPLVLAAHLQARARQRVSPISVEDRIELFAAIEETTWAEQTQALSPWAEIPVSTSSAKNAFDRFSRARAANLARLKDAAGVGASRPPAASKSLRSLLEAMAASDRTQLAEISRGPAAQIAACRETSERQQPVPALA
jgi:hypothetical protein